MATNVPSPPAKLKAIQHYLKTATEHDQRDPVVAYYCRLFSFQRAMEIDKKSPECRQFLVSLMDYLEKVKKDNTSNEAITNEVVGQAHMEHYALQVFLYADNEDRAARFGKNVVKSFYTAGMLFDVLSTFGELSEDIDKNRKYAKWKAAYIHKCLKDGETPISGPMTEDEDEGAGAAGIGIGFDNINQPGPSSNSSQPLNLPQPGAHAPPTTPQDVPQAHVPQAPVAAGGAGVWTPPANAKAAALSPGDLQKAMKYCKYASSALQYEDPSTAIDNLTKALKLLTTGKDT